MKHVSMIRKQKMKTKDDFKAICLGNERMGAKRFEKEISL